MAWGYGVGGRLGWNPVGSRDVKEQDGFLAVLCIIGAYWFSLIARASVSHPECCGFEAAP